MSQQQVFSGRYELVRHVARGGMAQVYLAKDLLLDRPVALKVLFPELSVDQSFVERFRREAQAAANLSHPNIVSVYDWGQGEHTYFIVLEYIDGPTLSSLIKQGPLDALRAATIGADVAAALDFAHRHGVIHRDVKPGNVLLDGSGQVKVADFGIARAIGAQEGLTQTGAVMGTATYFSPEQAQGYSVDVRSDIYSLGVVLYEMVVGKPPFAGENPVSIAYKHVREQPVSPTVANPAVPKSFEAIVMKAMAKNADERYQTAEELRADLVRFQNGQPVLAALSATPMVTTGPQIETTRVSRRVSGALPATPAGGAPDEAERSLRNGLFALALVGLLVVLALLLFFVGRQVGLFSSTKTLTIPADVVGKTAPAATAELKHVGFTKVSQTQQQTSKTAQGDVITTTPSPGTKQKSNADVTLVVSAGAPPVQVPNVAGEDQQTASTRLSAAGLVVTTAMVSSTTVAQGQVVGTNPAAGATLSQGAQIQLIVSSGAPAVQIPSLVGQSPTDAGGTLTSLGLKPTQTTEASQTIPAGQVTRTSPAAGNSVSVGSPVTVYVSSGPAPVTVPNLIGESPSQAEARLSKLGLTFNVQNAPTTTASQVGTVISQTPAANSTANVNSVVYLTVGVASPVTTTVPATTTAPPSTATTSTTISPTPTS